MSLNIRKECCLTPYHSFRLPGTALALVEVQSAEEMAEAWSLEAYASSPKLVLGSGSNTVFVERFEGLVIVNRIKGREVIDEGADWLVELGAGEDWHEAVMWSLSLGISGLENLSLIPGTAGAAPVQNIGAYGMELSDVCAYVDILDLEQGQLRRLSQEECRFGYRDSIFKGELKGRVVIVGVGLRLAKAWSPQLNYGPLRDLSDTCAHAIAERVMRVRREKLPDPSVLGNAGSFFKNPVVPNAVGKDLQSRHPNMPAYPAGEGQMKLAAGWLIEQSGMKGAKHHGVGVHQDQALVLVNHGEGTAEQLLALATQVVKRVSERFGVVLEPEVRLLNRLGEQCWSHYAD
ncbi:UDP-N-acetylmuramate dehydrogenase [Ferrimonas futtsuensis]|uniref:UDP-N-acetylmuramate dehydrogenase n=1 Tax=Ferrimonas futtsuensis TaxID=364764 RepID=UPI0003FD2079|nr:UDP-N-acetylmuramate dehydrogenase [Ferrimonas futtsuensis]